MSPPVTTHVQFILVWSVDEVTGDLWFDISFHAFVTPTLKENHLRVREAEYDNKGHDVSARDGSHDICYTAGHPERSRDYVSTLAQQVRQDGSQVAGRGQYHKAADKGIKGHRGSDIDKSFPPISTYPIAGNNGASYLEQYRCIHTRSLRQRDCQTAVISDQWYR